jgi:hypothetical protein
MTQATDTDLTEVLKRLDKLATSVESIHTDLQGLTLEVRTAAARNDERLKALDMQVSDLKAQSAANRADGKADLADIKTQLRAQDTRLWGFVITLALTVIGFLAKLAFASGGTA